jgi:hypothetical protein
MAAGCWLLAGGWPGCLAGTTLFINKNFFYCWGWGRAACGVLRAAGCRGAGG